MFPPRISTLFMRLQEPCDSLARETGLTTKIARATVTFVWDYYLLTTAKKDAASNFPRAYTRSLSYLKGQIAQFNKYKEEYKLSPKEEHEALLTWVFYGNIIENYDDLPVEILKSTVPDILLDITSLKNTHPLFSSASGPERYLIFDLKILEILDGHLNNYKTYGDISSLYFQTETDIEHIFDILNDTPPIETPLTEECKRKAKTLCNIFKPTRERIKKEKKPFEQKDTGLRLV